MSSARRDRGNCCCSVYTYNLGLLTRAPGIRGSHYLKGLPLVFLDPLRYLDLAEIELASIWMGYIKTELGPHMGSVSTTFSLGG